MSAAVAAAREQTARIARLNDLARRAMGVDCNAVATVGFRSLPDADQSRVREMIETYDAFDEDSDPHGERDFGTIYQLADGRWTTDRPRLCEDERERVFWKLDYYDRDLRFGSEDAANPAITRRVLDHHAWRRILSGEGQWPSAKSSRRSQRLTPPRS